MTIKVTYNVTDVYVTQDVSPVYINVSYNGGGSGAAVWGGITGTLSNQTDLQNALNAKFDDPTGTTAQYLRGDGSLATFPAIPSGTVQSVGLTMPSAFSVANSPVTSSGTLAVTGAGTTAQYIRGDGSLATFPSLTGYVPYTGATANVDLGTHRITAQNATIASSGSSDTVTLNHSSGSGVGLNITKGGNGEGLYINKTSGSGNAATIIGTINATTLVKSGGTSSQFLKADGSVDSSVYVPTSRELTINGVTFDLSSNRSWTVSGGISGSGASGQVAYWTGTSAQAGSNNLFWDATNSRLGIGTNAPTKYLELKLPTGISTLNNGITITRGSGTGVFLLANGTSNVNEFIPSIYSRSSVDNAGFYFAASVFSSGSTFPAMEFQAQNETQTGAIGNSQIVARWVNWTSQLMQIRGNGNLLLQNGGTFTDSGERLQVTGTMKVSLNQNAQTFLNISNSTSGTSSSVALNLNSSNGGGSVFKNSATSTTYKISAANDYGFYNGTSGDITFLNDVGAGNIKFAAGGSSTAHMTLHNTGNLLLGSTTNSGERLQVTGTMKVTGIGDSVVMDSGGVGSRVTLKLNTTSASYTQIIGNGTEFNFITIGSTPMTFGTNSLERMRIKSTGQVRFVPLASAPSSPQAGDVYYDSTLSKLRVYTTAWETITSI